MTLPDRLRAAILRLDQSDQPPVWNEIKTELLAIHKALVEGPHYDHSKFWTEWPK